MLEKYTAALLVPYLSKFVENIDERQLKIDIWSGRATLNDLVLKQDVLNTILELGGDGAAAPSSSSSSGHSPPPVRVHRGVCKSVSLEIPLTNLRSKPVVVNIGEIIITLVAPDINEAAAATAASHNCSSTSHCDGGSSSTSTSYDGGAPASHKSLRWDRIAAQKDKALATFEEDRRKKRESAAALAAANDANTNDSGDTVKKTKSGGFFSNLSELIINNIILKVKMVHVRYEDAGNRVVAGAVIGGLQLLTIDDATGAAAFVDPSAATASFGGGLRRVGKRLELEGLQVYCDDPRSLIANEIAGRCWIAQIVEWQGWYHAMRQRARDDSLALSTVFGPVSATVDARIVVKRFVQEMLETPYVTVAARLEQVMAHLTRAQYATIVKCISRVANWAEVVEVAARRPRVPVAGHARVWWRFAIGTVVSALREPRRARVLRRISEVCRPEYELLYRDAIRKADSNHYNSSGGTAIKWATPDKARRYRFVTRFMSVEDMVAGRRAVYAQLASEIQVRRKDNEARRVATAAAALEQQQQQQQQGGVGPASPTSVASPTSPSPPPAAVKRGWFSWLRKPNGNSGNDGSGSGGGLTPEEASEESFFRNLERDYGVTGESTGDGDGATTLASTELPPAYTWLQLALDLPFVSFQIDTEEGESACLSLFQLAAEVRSFNRSNSAQVHFTAQNLVMSNPAAGYEGGGLITNLIEGVSVARSTARRRRASEARPSTSPSRSVTIRSLTDVSVGKLRAERAPTLREMLGLPDSSSTSSAASSSGGNSNSHAKSADAANTSVDSGGASFATPLLSLSLALNPVEQPLPDTRLDVAASVRLLPLRIIADPGTIFRIVHFFRVPKGVDLAEFAASTRSAATAVGTAASQELRSAMATARGVFISVDATAPIVLLPQSLRATRREPTVAVSLGRLVFEARPLTEGEKRRRLASAAETEEMLYYSNRASFNKFFVEMTTLEDALERPEAGMMIVPNLAVAADVLQRIDERNDSREKVIVRLRVPSLHVGLSVHQVYLITSVVDAWVKNFQAGSGGGAAAASAAANALEYSGRSGESGGGGGGVVEDDDVFPGGYGGATVASLSSSLRAMQRGADAAGPPLSPPSPPFGGAGSAAGSSPSAPGSLSAAAAAASLTATAAAARPEDLPVFRLELLVESLGVCVHEDDPAAAAGVTPIFPARFSLEFSSAEFILAVRTAQKRVLLYLKEPRVSDVKDPAHPILSGTAATRIDIGLIPDVPTSVGVVFEPSACLRFGTPLIELIEVVMDVVNLIISRIDAAEETPGEGSGGAVGSSVLKALRRRRRQLRTCKKTNGSSNSAISGGDNDDDDDDDLDTFGGEADDLDLIKWIGLPPGSPSGSLLSAEAAQRQQRYLDRLKLTLSDLAYQMGTVRLLTAMPDARTVNLSIHIDGTTTVRLYNRKAGESSDHLFATAAVRDTTIFLTKNRVTMEVTGRAAEASARLADCHGLLRENSTILRYTPPPPTASSQLHSARSSTTTMTTTTTASSKASSVAAASAATSLSSSKTPHLQQRRPSSSSSVAPSTAPTATAKARRSDPLTAATPPPPPPPPPPPHISFAYRKGRPVMPLFATREDGERVLTNAAELRYTNGIELELGGSTIVFDVYSMMLLKFYMTDGFFSRLSMLGDRPLYNGRTLPPARDGPRVLMGIRVVARDVTVALPLDARRTTECFSATVGNLVVQSSLHAAEAQQSIGISLQEVSLWKDGTSISYEGTTASASSHSLLPRQAYIEVAVRNSIDLLADPEMGVEIRSEDISLNISSPDLLDLCQLLKQNASRVAVLPSASVFAMPIKRMFIRASPSQRAPTLVITGGGGGHAVAAGNLAGAAATTIGGVALLPTAAATNARGGGGSGGLFVGMRLGRAALRFSSNDIFYDSHAPAKMKKRKMSLSLPSSATKRAAATATAATSFEVCVTNLDLAMAQPSFAANVTFKSLELNDTRGGVSSVLVRCDAGEALVVESLTTTAIVMSTFGHRPSSSSAADGTGGGGGASFDLAAARGAATASMTSSEAVAAAAAATVRPHTSAPTGAGGGGGGTSRLQSRGSLRNRAGGGVASLTAPPAHELTSMSELSVAFTLRRFAVSDQWLSIYDFFLNEAVVAAWATPQAEAPASYDPAASLADDPSLSTLPSARNNSINSIISPVAPPQQSTLASPPSGGGGGSGGFRCVVTTPSVAVPFLTADRVTLFEASLSSLLVDIVSFPETATHVAVKVRELEVTDGKSGEKIIVRRRYAAASAAGAAGAAGGNHNGSGSGFSFDGGGGDVVTEDDDYYYRSPDDAADDNDDLSGGTFSSPLGSPRVLAATTTVAGGGGPTTSAAAPAAAPGGGVHDASRSPRLGLSSSSPGSAAAAAAASAASDLEALNVLFESNPSARTNKLHLSLGRLDVVFSMPLVLSAIEYLVSPTQPIARVSSLGVMREQRERLSRAAQQMADQNVMIVRVRWHQPRIVFVGDGTDLRSNRTRRLEARLGTMRASVTLDRMHDTLTTSVKVRDFSIPTLLEKSALRVSYSTRAGAEDVSVTLDRMVALFFPSDIDRLVYIMYGNILLPRETYYYGRFESADEIAALRLRTHSQSQQDAPPPPPAVLPRRAHASSSEGASGSTTATASASASSQRHYSRTSSVATTAASVTAGSSDVGSERPARIKKAVVATKGADEDSTTTTTTTPMDKKKKKSATASAAASPTKEALAAAPAVATVPPSTLLPPPPPAAAAVPSPPMQQQQQLKPPPQRTVCVQVNGLVLEVHDLVGINTHTLTLSTLSVAIAPNSDVSLVIPTVTAVEHFTGRAIISTESLQELEDAALASTVRAAAATAAAGSSSLSSRPTHRDVSSMKPNALGLMPSLSYAYADDTPTAATTTPPTSTPASPDRGGGTAVVVQPAFALTIDQAHHTTSIAVSGVVFSLVPRGTGVLLNTLLSIKIPVVTVAVPPSVPPPLTVAQPSAAPASVDSRGEQPSPVSDSKAANTGMKKAKAKTKKKSDGGVQAPIPTSILAAVDFTNGKGNTARDELGDDGNDDEDEISSSSDFEADATLEDPAGASLVGTRASIPGATTKSVQSLRATLDGCGLRLIHNEAVVATAAIKRVTVASDTYADGSALLLATIDDFTIRDVYSANPVSREIVARYVDTDLNSTSRPAAAARRKLLEFTLWTAPPDDRLSRTMNITNAWKGQNMYAKRVHCEVANLAFTLVPDVTKALAGTVSEVMSHVSAANRGKAYDYASETAAAAVGAVTSKTSVDLTELEVVIHRPRVSILHRADAQAGIDLFPGRLVVQSGLGLPRDGPVSTSAGWAAGGVTGGAAPTTTTTAATSFAAKSRATAAAPPKAPPSPMNDLYREVFKVRIERMGVRLLGEDAFKEDCQVNILYQTALPAPPSVEEMLADIRAEILLREGVGALPFSPGATTMTTGATLTTHKPMSSGGGGSFGGGIEVLAIGKAGAYREESELRVTVPRAKMNLSEEQTMYLMDALGAFANSEVARRTAATLAAHQGPTGAGTSVTSESLATAATPAAAAGGRRKSPSQPATAQRQQQHQQRAAAAAATTAAGEATAAVARRNPTSNPRAIFRTEFFVGHLEADLAELFRLQLSGAYSRTESSPASGVHNVLSLEDLLVQHVGAEIEVEDEAGGTRRSTHADDLVDVLTVARVVFDSRSPSIALDEERLSLSEERAVDIVVGSLRVAVSPTILFDTREMLYLPFSAKVLRQPIEPVPVLKLTSDTTVLSEDLHLDSMRVLLTCNRKRCCYSLDLGGHTLHLTGQPSGQVVLSDGCELTISNGTIIIPGLYSLSSFVSFAPGTKVFVTDTCRTEKVYQGVRNDAFVVHSDAMKAVAKAVLAAHGREGRWEDGGAIGSSLLTKGLAGSRAKQPQRRAKTAGALPGPSYGADSRDVPVIQQFSSRLVVSFSCDAVVLQVLSEEVHDLSSSLCCEATAFFALDTENSVAVRRSASMELYQLRSGENEEHTLLPTTISANIAGVDTVAVSLVFGSIEFCSRALLLRSFVEIAKDFGAAFLEETTVKRVKPTAQLETADFVPLVTVTTAGECAHCGQQNVAFLSENANTPGTLCFKCCTGRENMPAADIRIEIPMIDAVVLAASGDLAHTYIRGVVLTVDANMDLTLRMRGALHNFNNAAAVWEPFIEQFGATITGCVNTSDYKIHIERLDYVVSPLNIRVLTTMLGDYTASMDLQKRMRRKFRRYTQRRANTGYNTAPMYVDIDKPAGGDKDGGGNTSDVLSLSCTSRGSRGQVIEDADDEITFGSTTRGTRRSGGGGGGPDTGYVSNMSVFDYLASTQRRSVNAAAAAATAGSNSSAINSPDAETLAARVYARVEVENLCNATLLVEGRPVSPRGGKVRMKCTGREIHLQRETPLRLDDRGYVLTLSNPALYVQAADFLLETTVEIGREAGASRALRRVVTIRVLPLHGSKTLICFENRLSAWLSPGTNLADLGPGERFYLRAQADLLAPLLVRPVRTDSGIAYAAGVTEDGKTVTVQQVLTGPSVTLVCKPLRSSSSASSPPPPPGGHDDSARLPLSGAEDSTALPMHVHVVVRQAAMRGGIPTFVISIEPKFRFNNKLPYSVSLTVSDAVQTGRGSGSPATTAVVLPDTLVTRELCGLREAAAKTRAEQLSQLTFGRVTIGAMGKGEVSVGASGHDGLLITLEVLQPLMEDGATATYDPNNTPGNNTTTATGDEREDKKRRPASVPPPRTEAFVSQPVPIRSCYVTLVSDKGRELSVRLIVSAGNVLMTTPFALLNHCDMPLMLRECDRKGRVRFVQRARNYSLLAANMNDSIAAAPLNTAKEELFANFYYEGFSAKAVPLHAQTRGLILMEETNPATSEEDGYGTQRGKGSSKDARSRSRSRSRSRGKEDKGRGLPPATTIGDTTPPARAMLHLAYLSKMNASGAVLVTITPRWVIVNRSPKFPLYICPTSRTGYTVREAGAAAAAEVAAKDADRSSSQMGTPTSRQREVDAFKHALLDLSATSAPDIRVQDLAYAVLVGPVSAAPLYRTPYCMPEVGYHAYVMLSLEAPTYSMPMQLETIHNEIVVAYGVRTTEAPPSAGESDADADADDGAQGHENSNDKSRMKAPVRGRGSTTTAAAKAARREWRRQAAEARTARLLKRDHFFEVSLVAKDPYTYITIEEPGNFPFILLNRTRHTIEMRDTAPKSAGRLMARAPPGCGTELILDITTNSVVRVVMTDRLRAGGDDGDGVSPPPLPRPPMPGQAPVFSSPSRYAAVGSSAAAAKTSSTDAVVEFDVSRPMTAAEAAAAPGGLQYRVAYGAYGQMVVEIYEAAPAVTCVRTSRACALPPISVLLNMSAFTVAVVVPNRDIMFAAVTDTLVSWDRTEGKEAFSFSVKNFQIDNQTEISPCYDSCVLALRKSKGSAAISGAFKRTIIAAKALVWLDEVRLDVAPIALRVSDTLLVSLARFVGMVHENSAEAQEIVAASSAVVADRTRLALLRAGKIAEEGQEAAAAAAASGSRPVVIVAGSPALGQVSAGRKRNSTVSLAGIRPGGGAATVAAESACPTHRRLYDEAPQQADFMATRVILERLIVNPLLVRLWLNRDVDEADFFRDGLHTRDAALLSMMVASCEDVGVSVPGLVALKRSSRLGVLLQWVFKSYTAGLLAQIKGVVLQYASSLPLIGAPLKLFSGIGSGAVRLFREPVDGLATSPRAFAQGLASGSSGFAAGFAGGGLGAFSNLTNAGSRLLSMGGGVSEKERRNQNTLTGFASGITGLVRRPREGVAESGASGLAKGIAQGLVGVIANPLSGFLHDISRGTGTVAQLVTDSYIPSTKRLRSIRGFHANGGVAPWRSVVVIYQYERVSRSTGAWSSKALISGVDGPDWYPCRREEATYGKDKRPVPDRVWSLDRYSSSFEGWTFGSKYYGYYTGSASEAVRIRRKQWTALVRPLPYSPVAFFLGINPGMAMPPTVRGGTAAAAVLGGGGSGGGGDGDGGGSTSVYSVDPDLSDNQHSRGSSMDSSYVGAGSSEGDATAAAAAAAAAGGGGGGGTTGAGSPTAFLRRDSTTLDYVRPGALTAVTAQEKVKRHRSFFRSAVKSGKGGSNIKKTGGGGLTGVTGALPHRHKRSGSDFFAEEEYDAAQPKTTHRRMQSWTVAGRNVGIRGSALRSQSMALDEDEKDNEGNNDDKSNTTSNSGNTRNRSSSNSDQVYRTARPAAEEFQRPMAPRTGLLKGDVTTEDSSTSGGGKRGKSSQQQLHQRRASSTSAGDDGAESKHSRQAYVAADTTDTPSGPSTGKYTLGAGESRPYRGAMPLPPLTSGQGAPRLTASDYSAPVAVREVVLIECEKKSQLLGWGKRHMPSGVPPWQDEKGNRCESKAAMQAPAGWRWSGEWVLLSGAADAGTDAEGWAVVKDARSDAPLRRREWSRRMIQRQ